MRPLLMVYGNPDPSVTPQDVRVIFKNGDGMNRTVSFMLLAGAYKGKNSPTEF